MFCHHCGSQLKENATQCDVCGELVKDSESQSPPTVQKKAMPTWFKVVIAIAVIALIAVTIGILFTESLVEVVDEQLSAIKSNDTTKAYYAYTSQDFQTSTSLEQFKEFIKLNPVFSSNLSSHFTDRSIHENIGVLKGSLTNEKNKKVSVEYQLIKEDGKWKILSIKLIPSEETAETEQVKNELIKVVNNLLEGIKQKQLASIYENLTSPEFKSATSLEAFQTFVENFPVLFEYKSANFTLTDLNDARAVINASLKSADDSETLVEFLLVNTKGKWQVWSLQILSQSDVEKIEQESAPSFGSTRLHVKEGEAETGTDPNTLTLLPSDTKDIFLEVVVNNAEPNLAITALFKHLESQTFIEPVTAQIKEKGTTIISFSFTPPPHGWPKGHYEIVLTASTNLEKIVSFRIE